MIRELATYPDGGMVSLHNTKNRLVLVCTCNKYRIRLHCKHIIHAMADRADAEYKAPGDGRVHMVPIFMTRKHPLTVGVQIDIARKGEVGEALYEVHALVNDRPEYFLGYLTDSDGRIDIRSMFLEWLTGQADQAFHRGARKEHSCLSAHHSGDSDLLAGWDDTDNQELSRMLVDYWYFIIGNTCAACADIATVPL